jgi:hypothetical protein
LLHRKEDNEDNEELEIVSIEIKTFEKVGEDGK